MYKYLILLLLLTVSVGISQDYVQGQIIVKFKPNYRGKITITTSDGVAQTNIPAIDNLNSKWHVSKVEKIIPDPNPSELAKSYGMDLFYTFYFPENQDVYSVIRDFEKSHCLQYAEPQFIYKADELPNDPYLSSQWHISKTQCPLAWDITHGDTTVKVMVIDQGIDYNHQDMNRSYAINAPEDINHNGIFDPWSSTTGGDFDNIDNDGNGYIDDVIGYDFLNSDPDPIPLPADDHGTNCAGVPCAMTNNAIGVASMTWGCRYVAARCGYGGSIYNYLGAMYYAVARGVWVISMSFGGTGYSQTYQDAMNYCWAGGCVLVASAGNEYSGGAPRYPAGYDKVISTAATASNDYLSNWGGGQQSNYGPWVDLAAPGTGVLTTSNNNTYGAYDGTSLATPCVVAQAALLKSMYPTMTNGQCTLRIFESCDSMPDPQYLAGNVGHGRINVLKSVAQPVRCYLRTTSYRLNDGNNNYPEPNEDVAIITTMYNEAGYQNGNASATISCSDPVITITKNTASFGTIIAGRYGHCSADSFVFHVSNNLIPHRVRFIINISATPPSVHTVDTIYINIGLPRILLVDDDNGADYERWYKEAIDSLRTLYSVWTVATAGSPPLDTLLRYPVVVWFTGLDSLNTLTSTDQTNLTSYLNQGKNLFICGQNLGQNIETTPFYSNYMHASYVITHSGMIYALGVPGDPLGGVNGDTIVLGGAGGAANASSCDVIRPVSGAFGSFRYRNYADTTVYGAIRYAGSYKVVYFGMPFEAIDHSQSRYIQKWHVMQRILTFFNEPLPGIEYEQPTAINSYTKPSMNITPNPFSRNTRINFSVPVKGNSQLNIYNVSGELVNSITTKSTSITWDGTDEYGKNLINGVYFCELKTEYGGIATKAIILR